MIANKVFSLLEKKGIFDDKKQLGALCSKTTKMVIPKPESNITLTVKGDKPYVAVRTDHWSEHYLVKAPSKLKKEMLKHQAKGIIRELTTSKRKGYNCCESKNSTVEDINNVTDIIYQGVILHPEYKSQDSKNINELLWVL